MPEYETAPAMFVAPCAKVKVEEMNVVLSIGSLKVAVIFLLMATSASLSTGTVKITEGAVVSRGVTATSIHPPINTASGRIDNQVFLLNNICISISIKKIVNPLKY